MHILRFLRAKPLTPPKQPTERNNDMRKRDKSIFVRVTQEEHASICRRAEKCGLSVSEYLRKLALGYTPKATPPDAFYQFSSRINKLYSLFGNKISVSAEEELLHLIDDIRDEFLREDRR